MATPAVTATYGTRKCISNPTNREN
jgi:hypothetical protein